MPRTRNALREVKELGQAIWLDYIRRNMIANGELATLIEQDGLSGVTSNPAIFLEAISRHDDYDSQLEHLSSHGASAVEMYEALALEDIANAADLFRPLYDETAGADGYVSLEVSPRLARDTAGTLEEARRLHSALGRPNVMIKVPGTREGLPAVRQLIGEGVNVNITLLFSVRRYADVLDAYLAGLEERAAQGLPLSGVASVASFFLSRIDTLVDQRLDRLGAAGAELRGEAAIACARLAYQHFRRIVASERWRQLAAQGAQPQRLLWASTGVKDPDYSDVKYVEALIGPMTVSTLPRATLEAFRDHGRAQLRLEEGVDRAEAVPTQLLELGIELERIAEELENDGIRKFIEPFDALLRSVQRHAAEPSR